MLQQNRDRLREGSDPLPPAAAWRTGAARSGRI